MSGISNIQILQVLNKLENDCNVETLQLSGFCCWPIIRIVSSFKLISSRYKDVEKKDQKLGRQFFFTKFRTHPNPNKKAVLFLSDQIYKVVVEGVTYDRVLFGKEKLASEFGLDTIEIIFGNKNHLSSTDNVLYLGILSKVLAKSCAFIRCLIPTPKSLKVLQILRSIERYTNDDDRNISINKFSILVKILFVEYYSRYFKRLLVRINLARICTANYYNLDSMALILAGHRLGIPTINIQHGAQSKTHPAFSQWLNVPQRGYEILPNEFHCWDELSADVIRDWAKTTNKHSSEVIGYPWADSWKNQDISMSLPDEITRISSNFNILVTLQPSVGLFPQIIIDTITNGDPEWIWWVRPHPRQISDSNISRMNETYSELPARVHILQAVNLPLPALMSFTNIHITGFSSSVQEASLFGLQTILFHDSAQSYYFEYIQNGKAVFAPNSESCLVSIHISADKFKMNSPKYSRTPKSGQPK
jgi:hypothetical protein